jgi:fumarate reductase subunit C
LSATEVIPSPRRGGGAEGAGGRGEGRGQAHGVASRVYYKTVPATWWTRKRHYFWYVVREFTAFPLAIWLLLLLAEIKRAGDGPANYHPHASMLFVVFSVIAFLAAMYHSITFLNLAGVIIHLRVIDRPLPSWPIVWTMFILWAVFSFLIIYFLIWLGR